MSRRKNFDPMTKKKKKTLPLAPDNVMVFHPPTVQMFHDSFNGLICIRK